MAENDFNGDGFSDLAVGVPLWSSADLPGGWETGAVYLFDGSSAGIVDSAWLELVNPEVPDNGGHFGFRVAGPDLNGDGFSDLVVSALNSGSFASGTDVYVYFGGAGGIRPGPDVAFHEPDVGQEFGVSIAGLGDLDADGFVELGIGAPGRVRGNKVLVYSGGPAGLREPPTVVEPPSSTSHSAFGFTVIPGDDFDGDGFAELVVGAPFFVGSYVGEGRVFAYAGGTGGPEATPSVDVEDPEPEPDHSFGFAQARGDLDGDGFADLAIGATDSAGGGTVFAYRGGIGSLETVPWLRLTPPATLAFGENGFGRRLAVCDFNGDGRADLAVAAPLQRRDAWSENAQGTVFVWYGRDDAVPPDPTTVLWGPSVDETTSFGDGLACVGDVNADGYDDLAIGSPWEGRDGRVRLHLGSAAGLAETPLLVLDDPNPSVVHPGSSFGNAIASR